MNFLRKLKYLTLGIGLYKIGETSYWFGNEIYQRYYAPHVDLIERYGQCYALITGATSGIGREYALQLAKKGFNIVLVSRDETKLQEFKGFLETNYGVFVQTCQFDFSKSDEIERFKTFHEQIKDLDIGVVINNVGTYQCQKFEHQYPEDIKDIITVNTLPVALVSSYLIPSLLARNKRSCLLTVGSENGDTPSAYMSVYSASKAFDNTLTRALAQEYSDRNIDIVTTTPGPTTSNILKAMDQNRKKEADYKEKIFNFLVVCTPQDVVTDTLHRLGRGETNISGTWKHEIFEAFQVKFAPLSWYLKTQAGYDTYKTYADQRTSNIPPPKTKPVAVDVREEQPKIVRRFETDDSQNDFMKDSHQKDIIVAETSQPQTNENQSELNTTQETVNQNIESTASNTSKEGEAIIKEHEKEPETPKPIKMDLLIPKDLMKTLVGTHHKNETNSE